MQLNTIEQPIYLKIRDLSLEDRPREKLLQKGAYALSNAELLGILIGSGTPKVSAVHLAQIILNHYDNNLNAVAQCSIKELQKFKGIGEAKAIIIASAMELSRRRKNQDVKKLKICSADAAYQCMKSELADKTVEEFWIILLNRANYILKKERISTGGVSGTFVDPKIIFKSAFIYNSSGIILMHNHPSGNTKPSSEDIALTNDLVKSSRILAIPILDHIIFTDKSYFSFADENLI